MSEQQITLKSYRKEIEVLKLSMDVPTYEGEEALHHIRYEDVLLRLFNNKRDNKNTILSIENYYGSNEIAIFINLTDYLEDSYSNKDECINHLKDWFSAGVDISDDDIEVSISKGYLYSVPDYMNNVEWFEGNNFIKNYIEWED